jgi:hypothetical protein
MAASMKHYSVKMIAHSCDGTCFRFFLKATGARGGLFGAGGRFQGGTDPIMEKFNESIHFDKR